MAPESAKEASAGTLDPAARPAIGLVMPALDEERAIGRVLEELPKGWLDEVIVVDNGSRDRTSEAARAHGAQVVSEPRRGYGTACQAGIAALSDAIDIVVFLDADHSDYPADLVFKADGRSAVADPDQGLAAYPQGTPVEVEYRVFDGLVLERKARRP